MVGALKDHWRFRALVCVSFWAAVTLHEEQEAQNPRWGADPVVLIRS